MKKIGMKISLIFGCVIIVLVLVAGCGGDDETSDGTGGDQLPAPGRAAPDFELQNLDGETVALSDYLGSPVLLNFWATWCSPCCYEMPFIQAVYEDPAWDGVGLVILAVNLGESQATVAAFMEENGYDFTALLDSSGDVGTVKYNVRSIPTSLFIDENGIIQYIDVGAFQSQKAVEDRLLDLIEDAS